MNKEAALQILVDSAISLDHLLEILKLLDELRDGQDSMAQIDHSSLPTFGGAEPEDTSSIYSWDADRLLVGGDRWEIVTRHEWDDALTDTMIDAYNTQQPTANGPTGEAA